MNMYYIIIFQYFKRQSEDRSIISIFVEPPNIDTYTELILKKKTNSQVKNAIIVLSVLGVCIDDCPL